MIETNKLLRHILSVSTESILDLSPTVDPEIKDIVKNAFFLTLIVIICLYVLKLFYLSMILFRVMTSDETKTRIYPGGCSLCCNMISCAFMIVSVCLGIYSINQKRDFWFGLFYLVSLFAHLIRGFVDLVSLCNTENHNEYTLSYGLISMAIVIIESLSLNVGSFHIYYQYLEWKKDNKDVQLFPNK